jgi:phage protein U
MPGQIGCLGDIIFQVENKIVQTFMDMMWSGSANIAEHKIAGRKALTEFTGADADKISFNMMLTEDLGVDVEKEITKIQAHAERGTALPLVIGRKTYGKYRWLINAHSTRVLNHDPVGKITAAIVTVNIIEYLR